MARTIAGLFDTRAHAERAVGELVDGGVPKERISVITHDELAERAVADGTEGQHTADLATGAVGGGLLGGVIGALVGMVALAIPGIGPVLAAGPLTAALGSAGAGMAVGAGVGGVGGGLLGALAWSGISGQEAHVYAEGVRRGGTLVTVQCDKEDATRVADILHGAGAVDTGARGAEWRREGWNGYETRTVGYYSDDVDPGAAPPTGLHTPDVEEQG